MDDTGKVIAFAEFLQTSPLGHEVRTTGAFVGNSNTYGYAAPQLTIWCPASTCDKSMLATGEVVYDGVQRRATDGQIRVLRYHCNNCKHLLKLFTLHFLESSFEEQKVRKVGEWPPPHIASIPMRMRRVFGPHLHTFNQGVRAERAGFGIGAFAYYRRIVEFRKNDLIDAIMKVAERVGAPDDVKESLSRAKDETRFEEAMRIIKVPESILVDGHNPYKLLHSAYSEGLHAQSDQACLEFAATLRIVLVEMIRRTHEALEKNKELEESLAKIHKRASEIGKQSSAERKSSV